MDLHPCLTCGACCAFFRVSFYWHESEEGTEDSVGNKWRVPAQLSLPLHPTFNSLKGTEHKHHPRCEALSGRIGERVACKIYTQRPSPCRNFAASYENGKANTRCDDARRAHGLPALRREDWKRDDKITRAPMSETY